MNNSRHLGIFDPSAYKGYYIHIVGCGNIGSHAATALARMGFEKFVLYDFDKVEDVNVCTQNFDEDNLEESKIDAVAKKLLKINPKINIKLINEELTEESELFNDEEMQEAVENTLAVVSGVDSLEARAIIKGLMQENDILRDKPVIDGRLGKEQVEVYYMKKPSEWEVEPEAGTIEAPCTEKYIAYTPLLCAAMIASNMKKLCAKEEIPKEMIFDFVTSSFVKQ